MASALVMLAQGVPAQERPRPEPTLEQTLEWLSNNLGATGLSVSETDRWEDTATDVERTAELRIVPVEAKSCNITVQRVLITTTELSYKENGRRKTDRNLVRCTSTERIPLGSISSVTLEPFESFRAMGIQRGPQVQRVLLTASNTIMQVETSCGVGSKRGSTKSADFPSKDLDFLKRIQNALSHAVKLCKGKEVF